MTNNQILNRMIERSGQAVKDIAEVSGYAPERISACRYGTNNHNPSTFMIDAIREAINKIGYKKRNVWTEQRINKLMRLLNEGKPHTECAELIDCLPHEIPNLIKKYFRYTRNEVRTE